MAKRYRGSYRYYRTGSIHGWSQSHLAHVPGAASLKSANSLHNLPQLFDFVLSTFEFGELVFYCFYATYIQRTRVLNVSIS